MAVNKERAPRRRLPGDPDPRAALERMIRVDQAGEFGAVRIYQGQLAVLGNRPAGAAIREMAAQETRHRTAFDALLADRRVRPTLLSPVWDVAGFALGAATALLGDKAAMACTEAVEEVIEDHYARQRSALGAAEPELAQVIEAARADEIEHRDRARAAGAAEAPAYALLSGAIKRGARLAIWLSERI